MEVSRLFRRLGLELTFKGTIYGKAVEWGSFWLSSKLVLRLRLVWTEVELQLAEVELQWAEVPLQQT